MTNVSTTVKIVVSMVVAAALVATRFSSSKAADSKSRGLKGSRKLQFGGISISSATTDGLAKSTGSLTAGSVTLLADPNLVTGNGLTEGTSFGTSSSSSPGFGTSASQGAASGAGNSTAKQAGGFNGQQAAGVPEILFGNAFGDFASSGGGVGTFGAPILIPGTGTMGTPATSSGGNSKNGGTTDVPAVPGTPPVVIGALQTGGGGGGFGFTLGGGIGNVTSTDLGTSQAYGAAQSSGFGSGQGSSLFGTAGGSGGGTSNGDGGGLVMNMLVDTKFGTSVFNGTGGGLASGGAGAYVGFNPSTPVILGNFPLAP